MEILLGTKNDGKIREIRRILSDLEGLKLLTYREHDFSSVREDGRSFYENAAQKARNIKAEVGMTVLADDSGLKVEALGGRPGIRSSRFSGEGATDAENNRKLLALMQGAGSRRARFRSVAVLSFPDGREWVAKGELHGRIAEAPRGDGGFGYDPLFVPEGYDRTLAELGPNVKDRISHRARALEQLKDKLHTLLRP
ncbi:MAG: RdgB/HAM1 family non-canonical purine NTP pyrophosphatase [Candidatus Bipolaricaulia bacterium]